jgi:hypothetical protein
MSDIHSPVSKNHAVFARHQQPRKPGDRSTEILAETLTGKPPAISAKLTGANRCEALGIIGVGYSPVLVLCRQMLAAGISPDEALDVYRAGMLALRIRAIGEAARLSVEDHKNGVPKFRLARPQRDGAAPLVRFQSNSDPAEGGRR